MTTTATGKPLLTGRNPEKGQAYGEGPPTGGQVGLRGGGEDGNEWHHTYGNVIQ